MKKALIIIGSILICIFFALYLRYFQGAAPALLPPLVNIVDKLENINAPKGVENTNGAVLAPGKNGTEFPLKLSNGFSISVFAKGLNKPRVVKQDSNGNLWVSEIGAGAVTKLDVKDGKVVAQNQIFKNLKRPHGLAFDPDDSSVLFIAAENAVYRAHVGANGKLEKMIDLPAGGRHFSRTIGFGPDGRLHIAIGSSCDVCRESDERRAAVYSMNKDGSNFKLFAKGLRNTVFFAWNPNDGKMWGTDMGRDFLGDNLPPDEINIIEQDKNYGWPICYGKNNHDTKFDKNTYVRNPCMEPFETPSHIDLPAHSAPLGLAFIPENSKWPKEYWGDLLVAYHGSWNRTEPTGYKIVRLEFDKEGNVEEAKPRTDSALAESGARDFISGWLDNNRSSGRPVDLLVLSEGVMYVTDDKAGVVYRVVYQ